MTHIVSYDMIQALDLLFKLEIKISKGQQTHFAEAVKSKEAGLKYQDNLSM